jgi:hypothetical protein
VRQIRRYRFDAATLPIALMSAVSAVGTVCTPLLLDHPILLMMLSPRVIFLGMAASSLSLLPFVFLATIRLCLVDPFHFLLGRRHGEKVLRRFGRFGRWLSHPQRKHRVIAIGLLVVRPIGRHLMWAGSQRVDGRVVAALDVVSTAIFCVVVHMSTHTLI